MMSRLLKRYSVTFAILLSLVFLLSAPVLLVGLAPSILLNSRPDQDSSIEAIVVLGRGIEMRTAQAEVVAQLWQQNLAPRIFISGVNDTPEILRLLEEKSIPKLALAGENCSQTTVENAILSAAILKRRGIQRILLVTDQPHMLRAFLVFRSLGFSSVSHSVSLPNSWSTPKKILIFLRESVGLVSYAIQGKFDQKFSTPYLAQLSNLAIRDRCYVEE